MARRLAPALALLAALACVGLAERRERALAAAAHAERAGDLERAVELLTTALRYDPRDLVLTNALARALLAAERHWQAEEALRRLPADVERDAAHQRLRARARLQAGDLAGGARLALGLAEGEQADPALERDLVAALVRQPQDLAELPPLPAPWLHAALERLLAGREPAAASIWRHLPASDPRRIELGERVIALLLAADATAVAAGVPELLELPATAPGLLLRHRVAVASGRWEAAAAAERTFARLFPEESGSYAMTLSMARRRLRTGDVLEGLRLAERALELKPDGIEALLERALALQALGRPAARAAFEAVLAADPSHAAARRFLATGAAPQRAEVTLRVTTDGREPEP
jgi:tetratricopeptide (TPR) repeat protein